MNIGAIQGGHTGLRLLPKHIQSKKMDNVQLENESHYEINDEEALVCFTSNRTNLETQLSQLRLYAKKAVTRS